MTTKHPFISLCLIVRDEEASLHQCLDSVQGAYDELIVVDTGSTDRTVEIAREFGARIKGFEWGDDFSAARNHACSLARGTWIVMIDGDECLAPAGIGPRLPAMLRQIPGHVDKLLIEQRTLVGQGSVSLLVDRVFRNTSRLRWKYRIHEVLETPLNRTAKTHDVYLLHDNSLKRKADLTIGREREAMYLRALALDMEDHPDDPRPAFYCASTLYGAGRDQEAMEAYEHYFGLSEDREPVRRAVAFRDAATVAGRLGDLGRRRHLLFRSLEHDWRSSETYQALSDLALGHENLDEAIHWLSIAADCPQTGSEMYWSSWATGAALWRKLAGLYRRKGEDRTAQLCDQRAESLQDEPFPDSG
jgi:glycosyltransferase involved in cell wall biosynthesis